MLCRIFATMKESTRMRNESVLTAYRNKISGWPKGKDIRLSALLSEVGAAAAGGYYVSHGYALRKLRRMRRYPHERERMVRREFWEDLLAKVDRRCRSGRVRESDALAWVLAGGTSPAAWNLKESTLRAIIVRSRKGTVRPRRPLGGNRCAN